RQGPRSAGQGHAGARSGAGGRGLPARRRARRSGRAGPPTPGRVMARLQSAGLLLHRVRDGRREVLLGHLGGPFWARRHARAWSIPKGGVEPGEEPEETARREFVEELGVPVPPGPWVDLGEVRQSRKDVRVWAVEADLDPDKIGRAHV